VQDPDGQMPRDMRLTFFKRRRQLQEAIKKMLAWKADGRRYEKNGTAELHRAFRWILD